MGLAFLFGIDRCFVYADYGIWSILTTESSVLLKYLEDIQSLHGMCSGIILNFNGKQWQNLYIHGLETQSPQDIQLSCHKYIK